MTDTEVLIRDCLDSYAERAELADLVPAAKARSRQLSRGRGARMGTANRQAGFRSYGRGRLILAAGVAAVVVLVGTAFVLGGRHSSVTHDALKLDKATSFTRPGAAANDFQKATGRKALSQTGTGSTVNGAAPTTGLPIQGAGHSGATAATGIAGAAAPAVQPPQAAQKSVAEFGPLQSNSLSDSAVVGNTPSTAVGDGLGATRIVKTGSLSLRVRRNQVQATVKSLVSMTTTLGGYVSQSRTDTIAGSPSAEVTLRMPSNKFDDAVSGAQSLGHQISLSTNAHDVTGRFVDLNARLSALRHTRATYLTILGHATTIGSTLEVQDRVNGVQSQIERLQGELKVLRNQSADGTLTVDVSQTGTPTTVVKHHRQGGFTKAWHNSTRRFNRGMQAIVGALGPLLLALLVVAFLAIVARLGIRGFRRARS